MIEKKLITYKNGFASRSHNKRITVFKSNKQKEGTVNIKFSRILENKIEDNNYSSVYSKVEKGILLNTEIHLTEESLMDIVFLAVEYFKQKESKGNNGIKPFSRMDFTRMGRGFNLGCIWRERR